MVDTQESKQAQQPEEVGNPRLRKSNVLLNFEQRLKNYPEQDKMVVKVLLVDLQWCLLMYWGKQLSCAMI